MSVCPDQKKFIFKLYVIIKGVLYHMHTRFFHYFHVQNNGD